MLDTRQIAFDQLAGRISTLKAFLVEETVKKPQQQELVARIDAANASKGQKIRKTISKRADKLKWFHWSNSGHSRATCLSVSRSSLV